MIFTEEDRIITAAEALTLSLKLNPTGDKNWKETDDYLVRDGIRTIVDLVRQSAGLGYRKTTRWRIHERVSILNNPEIKTIAENLGYEVTETSLEKDGNGVTWYLWNIAW